MSYKRTLKLKYNAQTTELDWENPNCLDHRYLEYIVNMYNERVKYAFYLNVRKPIYTTYYANSSTAELYTLNKDSYKNKPILNSNSQNIILDLVTRVNNLYAHYIDHSKLTSDLFEHEGEYIGSQSKICRFYFNAKSIFFDDFIDLPSLGQDISISMLNTLLKQIKVMLSKCEWICCTPNMNMNVIVRYNRSIDYDTQAANKDTKLRQFFCGNIGEMPTENIEFAFETQGMNSNYTISNYWSANEMPNLTTWQILVEDKGANTRHTEGVDVSYYNNHTALCPVWTTNTIMQVNYPYLFPKDTPYEIWRSPKLTSTNYKVNQDTLQLEHSGLLDSNGRLTNNGYSIVNNEFTLGFKQRNTRSTYSKTYEDTSATFGLPPGSTWKLVENIEQNYPIIVQYSYTLFVNVGVNFVYK